MDLRSKRYKNKIMCNTFMAIQTNKKLLLQRLLLQSFRFVICILSPACFDQRVNLLIKTEDIKNDPRWQGRLWLWSRHAWNDFKMMIGVPDETTCLTVFFGVPAPCFNLYKIV